jgi:putative transposase
LSIGERKSVIEHSNEAMNKKRMCELLGVPRSSMYYKPKPSENNDLIISNEVMDIYTESPTYGYRKILVALRERGFAINHKRLQRLLAQAGIKAIYPTKRTTIRNVNNKVYPYLLRDLCIDRPNQAWQTDITYIKVKGCFVYLICLIDVFSRKIMGWNLSTFMDTSACLIALSEALKIGKPEIINSDQGCQFTSDQWTEFLISREIRISMDGKGRWADNVYVERLWRTIKYENIFLHSFDKVEQAREAVRKFIKFYNEKRYHQSLNYHTPEVIFEFGKIPSKQELFESFKLRHQLKVGEAVMVF